MARKYGFLTIAALGVAAAVILALGAPVARASHISVLTAEGPCYTCHNLSGDPTLGYEPNTSYINRNTRTLSTMKILNGGQVPEIFGCTYCHNDPTRVTVMKDALADFATQTSMHFVGLTRTPPRTQTWNEYVSNRTGGDFLNAPNPPGALPPATPIADELQCSYCHDSALVDYPDSTHNYNDHAAVVATNPNRLRGFSTASANPYNDSCVNTCHDGDYEAAGAPANLPNGEAIPRMGHFGWAGYTGGAAPVMREPRGGTILEVRCQICHDTHSSNKANLISDGTDGDAEIVETNCTAVCHSGAAAGGPYRTIGHGKPMNRENTVAIAFSYTTCAPCHNSAVPHQDPANPARFGLTEDPAKPSITYNGANDSLDNNMNGTVDEAAESSWSFSATSICRTCHSAYNLHSGTIVGGPGSAGCLDCHDPHGTTVGANIEMVRNVINGEQTTYVLPPESPTPDFYRSGDARGACDNAACHAKALGNDTTPGTIMGDVSAHQGVGPGTNCTSCHVHAGPASSFAPNCDFCHGYPPNTADTLADNTNAVGVHAQHQAKASCSDCHFNLGNQHNESLWTSYPGFPVPTANVDVVFHTHGGTVNLVATYDPATHTCTNVTCHNPDSNTAGEGITGKVALPSSNNPQWLNAFTPITACTDCHLRSDDNVPPEPDGGSHFKHDNSGQRNYPCEYCHQNYFSETTHVNLLLETDAAAVPIVVIGGTLGAQTLGGTYNNGTGVCSTVYCHGTTLAAGGSNLSPTWGTAGSGACGACHDNDTTDTTPATSISTGNHTTHVNAASAPYGPRAACTNCHAPTTSAQHVDGNKNFSDGNLLLGGSPTTACNTCHNGSAALAKSEWALAPGHWRTVTGGYCEHCHDATPSTVNTLAGTGGADAVALDKSTWFTSTGHGNATGYNATLHGQAGPGYLCTECHTTASAHIDATPGNTDRLRAGPTDALAYTTANSEFCLDCHRSGQTANGTLGRDAAAEASVHSGGVNSRFNTAGTAPLAFPRYGDAGNYAANPGYQCNACHDPHGTQKLAMVLTQISGGGGWPTTTIAGFLSSGGDLSGLDPTTASDSGVCDACHAAAASTHPDTAPPVAGPNGNHNHGDGGDSCMKCHNHELSFRGSCTDCHGNPGTGAIWPDGVANNGAKRVVYADDELGSHAEHIATLQAREGYTLSTADQILMCGWCHASPGGADHDLNGGADSRADVNGPGIPRIDGTANKSGAADAYLAPSYTAAARTCANVDCHYNATTPAYAGLGWDAGDANTSTCTICHAATAGYVNGSLPNTHDTHVGGKGLACTQCHPNHAADYQHLNGSVQVVFDNTNTLGEPGAVAPSAAGSDNVVKYGALAGTFATCSALYCHGNDTYEAAGGFQLAGGTLTTPRWNVAADGDCGTCHDTGTQAGETSPGTALATGNHTDHLSAAYGPVFGTAALTACDQCHPVYAVGSASHVNGTRDFQNNDTTPNAVSELGLTAPAVDPPTTSTDRCTNCHSTASVSGSVGTVLAKTNWASGAYVLPCLNCHNVTDQATSQVGGGGVLAPGKDTYYAVNNGGHGYNGASTGTGNAMPNYGCSQCHDTAVAHISGVLDDTDRLPGGLTQLTACADCHAPGQPAGPVYGVNAAVEASNHATAVTGRFAANPAYNYACVVCHDPHGTSNIAMVNTTIVDGMGANATGVVLAALTGLDPTSVADNGVCDRCHADAGGQPHAITGRPGNHNWGGTGDSCVVCHLHTKSFEGTCTDCHGNPANAGYGGAATFWPDGVLNNPRRVAYADDEIGSHAEHIAVLQAKEGFTLSAADQVLMCNWCHPVSDSTHLADNAPAGQVDVDTAGILRIDGVSNKAGSADLNAAPTYNTVAKTCGTVDCHYETTTPAYGGLGWDGGDTNASTCTTCHQSDAAYSAAGPGALPNAHLVHVDERADAGYDVPCASCHPDHLADVQHLNGSVDFSFATALGEPGPTAGTQAGSDAAVKYGVLAGTFATCSNFYCHGDDMPAGATGSDPTPTWNTVATGDCGTCHDTGNNDTTPSVISSGNHTDHLTAAYGPLFGADNVNCIQCHPAYFTTPHVNGQDDFANVDTTPNAYSTLGATAPTVDPPANSTDRCTSCHSTASVSGSAGTVLAKSNWTNGAYLLPCLNCHNATDPATQNADGSGVAAPAKDAWYAVNNGGHGFNGTSTGTGNAMPNYACSQCHAPAAAHISGALDDTDRLPGGLTQLTACADCHAPGQPAGPVYGINAAVEASNHASSVTGMYAANPAYAYGCVVCHDPHGTPNIAMVNATIVDGMGANATGVTLAAETGLDPAGADNGVCDRCHADAAQPHALTARPGNHNQGSTCLTCHNHELSFQGSCTGCHGDDVAKTIWPDGVAGNNPTRVVYADDAPGAHAKHIALLQAKEGFTLSLPDQQLMCGYCHPSPGVAGHETNNAPLNQVDVDTAVFKRIDAVSNKTGTVDGNVAAVYSDALKTCATTDCHYETTTPGWESGTVMTCTTCHGGDAPYANNALPNAHNLHANEIANAGYNYACTVCHASGAYATTHLDGDVAGDVSFAGVPWGLDADEALVGGNGLVKYGAAPAANYYSCQNVSCHGDYSGGNTANAPNWYNTDAVLGATNGDGNCGSCHGTDATKDPLPVYADGAPKANKHPKHHTANGYGCQVCHWPTTTTGTSITNRPTHANGSANVDDDAAAPTLDSFTYAGGAAGTCNTTECHGGGSVNWNQVTPPRIACNVCHGQVGGAVTNVDVNNFAWDGAIQSKIANSEYVANGGGHGDNTAPNQPNKACSACHDSDNTDHDLTAGLTGANPYRLVDQDGATGGVQHSCSATVAGCHVAGLSGPQTGLALTSIVTHSDEAMAAAAYTTKRAWPAWDPQCVNCHDPHGDGSNLSMIQREIYDKAAFTIPAGPPAAPPTEQTNLVFTNSALGADASGTSYADTDGPFSSICQECHESDPVSFHDNNTIGTGSGANHPNPGGNPGDCSNCHKHDSAFKPSGCNGCHGDVTNKNYWPDQAAYPDTAGAHLNHVNAIGTWLWGETNATGLLADNGNGDSDTKQKTICAWCHPNPGNQRAGKAGETSHDDNGAPATPADVLGDGVVAAQFLQYYNGNLAARGSVNDTSATYSSVNKSCSLSNCHNEVATPSGATNWNTPPAWTTVGCAAIQCHGTAAASGRHLTHYGAAAKGYACTECHVLPASLWHPNGQVNLAWTAGLENDGDGFYDHDATTTPTAGDNSFAPPYDGGAANAGCYNVYCHGDFTGGLAPVPTWNGAAACGTCHNATTATMANGSHTTHFNATWGANLSTCDACHTGSLLTTASHADGVKTIVTSPVLATPSTLAATTVCNNCHGVTTYDTEVIKANWPDAAANTYTPGSANPDVTCESCHGGGDTAATQNANGSGGVAPAKTANFTTTGHGLAVGSTYSPSGRTGAGTACVGCHAPASAHLSATGGDTDRLASAGNLLCTNCHDGTPDGAGGKSAVQVSTHANTSTTMTALPAIDRYAPQRLGFELNCVECHDVHGTANIYMVTPSNPNGPLVATRLYGGVANTTTPLFNSAAVAFTAHTAGTDFAVTAANATKICQTCHTTTGGATPVYRHNAATSGHDTAACVQCHAHDIDDNYLPASQDAFMPRKNCMNCHNGSTSGPNVMTFWLGSNGTKQDGGHGDPEGRDAGPAPVCADCHDTSVPSGTHLDGTYNSPWNNTSRNANTSHLLTEYFNTARVSPPPPVGNGTWSVQVAFDNYCAEQCHVAKGVPSMRHERDTLASDNNHWSVELGTHLTYSDGDTISYPIDADINTAANAADVDYATCVTCHDPHGTGVVEPTKSSNRMVRDGWISVPTLCNACHN